MFFRKWVGKFAKRNFQSFLTPEAEKQLELAWEFGLHFVPFFLRSDDDDDFRQFNVLHKKGSDKPKTQNLKDSNDKAALDVSKIQNFNSVLRTDVQESRLGSTFQRPSRPSSVGAISHRDLVSIIISYNL